MSERMKKENNPWAAIFYRLKKTGVLNKLPDSAYLKFMFRASMNKKLDLRNPRHLMRSYSGLNYMIEKKFIPQL